MALQILIGGNDITKYVDLSTIKITSNIATSKDTGEFTVIIPNNVIQRPLGGQEVVILNGSIREFAGVVINPKETALAAGIMQYDTNCKDYTYWFDKRVVTDTYDNMDISAIVKAIVSNYTTGFTTNNVQITNAPLTEIKFDHVAPSQAIQKLADSIGWQWWIDYNKDLHFGPVMSEPSPLPNNTLLPDTDTQNYSDLEIDEDVSQVRNQVYLTGYKIPAAYTITQSFVCDGQTDTFYTTYEPKHNLKSIKVILNGAVQKLALDIAGGLPNSQLADGTCYIYYTNQSFRFNVAPVAGTVLSITYYPMFPMVNMYNDPNAMTLMQQRDLQDGLYEFNVKDTQLTSLDMGLANIRGQLELFKYAYPLWSGQFNSFLQGWQTGQFFYMTSNTRMGGFFQNYPFNVIKLDKIVVSHPINGTPTLQYTVYFSSTPYSF